MAAKGDSNLGSLDCESGILPLSYRAPLKIIFCSKYFETNNNFKGILFYYFYLLYNATEVTYDLLQEPQLVIPFEP